MNQKGEIMIELILWSSALLFIMTFIFFAHKKIFHETQKKQQNWEKQYETRNYK